LSRPPFERKSGAVVVIPVVAIVAALLIGAVANRDEYEPRRYVPTPPSTTGPRSPGVVLAASKSGLGTPQTPSGDFPNTPAFPSTSDSVAWARFDFAGSLTDLLQFRRSMMLTLVDNEGKHWPFDEMWLSNSIYLVVPPGYAAAPRKLYARLSVSGREMSNVELPSLPKPRKRQFESATAGWKGLVAESVRLLSDQRKARRVFIDCPMPSGNVLTVRILGTPFLDPKEKSEWLVRGPDPGRYFQVVDLPLRYPESSSQAFLEIMELKPIHIRKRITLDKIPMVEKFDLPWITGESAEIPFSSGVSFRFTGWGAVPYRRGTHPTQSVNLRLASRGLVRHVKAMLVSPTMANGVPFRVESRTFTLGDVEYSKTPTTWTGGPLSIVMDIEADVYKVVNKSLVAIDLTKARTIPDPISKMINPFPLLEVPPSFTPPQMMAQFTSPVPVPQIAH